MNKRTIRITCAQIDTNSNAKQQNMAKMKRFMDKAIEQYPDTDLILFPEYVMSGIIPSAEVSETPDSAGIREMADYAKEKNVHLVFGYLERNDEDECFYNSAILISNEGEVLGNYRKMHLVEEEKKNISAGNSGYPVFDTAIGKIGIMICWDSAFPEVARSLALKGADYLVIPSAWETPRQKDWDLVQQARAFDNVIFTACCNLTGEDVGIEFFGRSKITGPTGEVLSEVVEGCEAVVSAVIDLDAKTPLREGYYALLKDRRPDTYSELTKKGV